MNGVLAVYREPLGFAPRVARLPEGLSLEQMQARVRGLPPDFAQRGKICINGHAVPTALWGMVKPKAMSHGVPVEVTFHAPVMGGGGEDGGKQVFALIASIAITVLTGAILGGTFATASGLFAKGTISASLLAAGVSLGASLLMSALAPPPTVDNGKKIVNPGAASAEGNALEPNGPAPRVIGTRKVFPPLAAEPLVYFDGPDEVVEAVYILAGPHALSDTRVGAAQIDSLTNLEVETREGWPGDAALTVVRRQGRSEAVQAELRGHTVSDSDGRTLDSSTGDTVPTLPQAQVVATRRAPDEHQLQIMFGQGLHYKSDEGVPIRVPFRLRLRAVGSAVWVNLPELHFQAANVRQLRATIRLIWTDDASTTPGAAYGTEGWVEARIGSPGQTASPATDAWAADAYFDDGAGDDHMASSNLGSTAVNHVIMTRYEAAIYLDTATFTPGRYEVEIARGAGFQGLNYDSVGYTVSGTVWDFWGYQGTPGQIVESRDGVSDAVYLLRSVSIWNEHPLPSDDFATIGIRARNRQVEALSCVASGWVKDWGISDPRETSAPTFNVAQLGTMTAAAFDGAADAYFEIDLKDVPAAPTGCLWEVGGGSALIYAAYCGFTSGALVFRAGNGAAGITDTARLSVAASEVAGKTGTLIGEIDISAATVKLWFWDSVDLSLSLLGTAVAAAGDIVDGSGLWRGANPGAVGKVNGTYAAGEDGTDYNGAITAARFWSPGVAPVHVASPTEAKSWSHWVTTSNPAPHFRDVLAGAQNADPLPEDIIDDAGLVAWRTACAAAGFECNAIIEGGTVDEAARIIAGCGYAKPYMSEVWGVVRDYDRSAESPVQIFTPRNSSGFQWTKAFSRVPDGLRVNWRDSTANYDTRQTQVFRPGVSSDTGLLEQITYEGLITEAEIEARARYDLAQPTARGTFYSLDAPAEAIVVRRGSLVGVSHDMLGGQYGAARVVDVEHDGAGGVLAVWLDSAVPVLNEPPLQDVADVLAIADMLAVGARTGAAIRRASSTTVHELTGDSALTDMIRFADPIDATGIDIDALVAVGPLAREYLRLIVFAVTPRENLTATLTMVNEAPELWS